MTVPYTFANATGALPLLELDVNFASVSNSIAAATGNITFNDTTITTAAANSNIVVSTNSGNVGSNWTFGSNGALRIPGAITSANSIALFANTAGASNITLIANGAVGNSSFVFDSSGSLTAPGNVVADAFVGSGEHISDLLLNSTVGNIVSDLANTNSNVANISANVSINTANIITLTAGLANTNSNVANLSSNVANLTVAVVDNTANIANLQSNSYSNVNAAAYLRVYGGNILAGNVNTTGNISAQILYTARDIYAAGNLYVNGTDTFIDTTQITSNVPTLTLNHDVTTGNLADLDESGLLLGQNGLVSWTYDSPTNSWQTNVDIQPRISTVNLGNLFNPWNAVYANSVITPSFTATSVVANIANIDVLNVPTSANISTLTVDTNANIAGDLQVNGNSTIINVSAISSNVSTLILDKDNSTGILADGSGIQIGLPAIGTFLYNYSTTSWQSSIDITPAGNTVANLGNINNRWFNVYTLDVESDNVNSININTANVFSELMYANTIYASANVYSDLLFGNVLLATSIVGNIITPAQPNITSVGVLTNLSVAGNINANTVISNVVIANTAILAQINAGNASMSGNITASMFIGNGSQLTNVVATTAATVTDNAQPNITSVGTLTSLSVTGNIDAGNVYTPGQVSATGNITGSFIIGNGSQLTGLPAAYANANAQAYFASGTSNANISITGNILTTANVSATGNITGSYIIGNGSQLTGMPELYGNANVANYLPLYNGNLTSINTVTATGNITASYFIGNGSQLTGMPELYGNANVANYLPLYSGNLDSVNNVTATGNVAAGNIAITSTSLTWPNASIVQTSNADVSITGDGQVSIRSADGTYQWTFGADGTLTTPGTVSAAGNVTANALFINGNAVITGNANIQGTLTYNDITNLTTDNLVIGLGNNQVGIDVTGAGLVVGNLNQATLLYDFTANSWTSNINLSAAGNITARGNAVAELFVGNGAALYNVVAVTVQDPAQPNITSVGTLSSLTVTGNVTGNYIIGDGSLLTNINANVDQLINGSYSVDLSSDGVLQYASVNDQQQALTGTTTTVYGDPYTIEAAANATVIIWTATSNAAVGFKMSVRTQTGNAVLGGITNVELADIACASDGGTANISFVISNRVKSNISAPDTTFSVATNVNGNLIVRATNNDSQTEFYTHSVTEFNKT